MDESTEKSSRKDAKTLRGFSGESQYSLLSRNISAIKLLRFMSNQVAHVFLCALASLRDQFLILLLLLEENYCSQFVSIYTDR
jgi:hypothetical protein